MEQNSHHLSMQSKDGATERLRLFRQLFPEALTESIDEDGNVLPAIDADKLSQLLASRVVEGKDERYQFTWPDKRKAIRSANVPTTSCLRPCREDSVNFDTTQNLYLEGDNLEVLKVLRESYLGKVKMIYIDPPYNTGNDFVYNDDFTQDVDAYKGNSGQQDELGNRLVQNTEANGRYHTDWLNMMYPRLKVARDFLSDDGVIFISIDDNEVTNLHKICDEIFGEGNFIGQISMLCNPKGRSQDKYIATCHEYILIYSKRPLSAGCLSIPKTMQEIAKDYPLVDADGNLYRELELRNTHREFGKFNRPNLCYPLYASNDGSVTLVQSGDQEEIYPLWDDGFEGCWTWGKDKAQEYIHLLVAKKIAGRTKIYRKAFAYAEDKIPLKQVKSIWNDKAFYTEKGQAVVNELFGKKEKLFQGPKSVNLISQCVAMSQDKEAIVLDFFSGSATTAHAVMQLNAEDGGKRRFIMVQLQEACDEKSEAFKAGFKNVCELAKERIRRAGYKIQEATGKTLDIGFRVLKCDSSNMADVFYSPDDIALNPELLQADNIKPDRTADDLLFQIMPELNIPLSASVETIELGGRPVYRVQDGYLLAVLEEGAMSDEFMRLLAEQHAPIIATRNSCLGTDADAINLEQYMRSISPETQIHIL